MASREFWDKPMSYSKVKEQSSKAFYGFLVLRFLFLVSRLSKAKRSSKVSCLYNFPLLVEGGVTGATHMKY
jgi:hypothetical protein